MLENTFVHIPGIGKRTENRLWATGCLDWTSLSDGLEDFSCGQADKGMVRQHLDKSIQSLRDGEHQYFARRLRQLDVWRAYEAFRHSCVYLDIETDGGSGPGCVTTIGLYDGKEFTCLVKGDSLESFRDHISRYSMIVTFFGSGFDIPVLERNFRGLMLDQIHLDLHPVLKKLGYRGGLKSIEKELGIKRGEETDGLTGRDAVRLWRRYWRFGEASALERLIAYNRDDVMNLVPLAEQAYRLSKAATFEQATRQLALI